MTMEYLAGNLIARACTVTFLFFLSVNVYAWSYEEHVEISDLAYASACETLRNKRCPGQTRCLPLCNKKTRICYAHFVANVADRFRDVESLKKHAESSWFGDESALRHCLNFDDSYDASLLASLWWRNHKLENRYGDILRNPVRKNISSIFIASSNKKHFLPWARGAWCEHLKTSLNMDVEIQRCHAEQEKGSEEKSSIDSDVIVQPPASTGSIENAFIHHAFSTHFLQDSFSAGHTGTRREDLMQDYDMAYHDDLNIFGQNLVNERGDEWFTFGDKNLKKNLYIVLVDFKKIQTIAQLRKSLIEKFSAFSVRYIELEEMTVPNGLENEPARALNNTVQLLRYSGAVRQGDTDSAKLVSCSGLDVLTDVCDHVQILVKEWLPKPNIFDFSADVGSTSRSGDLPTGCGNSKNLDSVADDEVRNGIAFIECNPSFLPVFLASKYNILAFLADQYGFDKLTNRSVERTESYLPAKYRKLQISRDSENAALNSDFHVIERTASPIFSMGSEGSSDPSLYQKLGMLKLGGNAAALSSNATNALALNVSIGYFEKWLPWIKDNRNVGGTLNVEVYNYEEDDWFNGFSYSVSGEFWRPEKIFGRTVGLSAVVGLGWTNIWRGERPLDFFGDIGLQANLHLGKYGLNLGAFKRLGDDSFGNDGYYLRAGFSLSSISLGSGLIDHDNLK